MRKLFDFLMRPAVTLWLSAGLLIAYPLSSGPAFFIVWNVELPAFMVDGFRYFFAPLAAFVHDSKHIDPWLEAYVFLWLDVSQPQANEYQPWPEPPPFFLEVSGTLIGAWFVWNFVRWLNQRAAGSARRPLPACPAGEGD
jgi:hypothetical protein